MIDRGHNEDAAVVRNLELLETVAEFLGVHSSALKAAISYKTKFVKKELCTVFLDPNGASDNRGDLAKTFYSLLFAWLNEHTNRPCAMTASPSISLMHRISRPFSSNLCNASSSTRYSWPPS
ncbi:hypothetical protein Hypma_004170 [Hypsizygus marmoreus]|uniref:Myosin motor domain-containing protein n=1 Tax=Hypsizygus marmoreus TaxID=39966 RepID=A0A369J0A3_HYPMA|nr:hypothetical protein Hypma_004170 [Hypsizygus marmoreus]